MRSAARAIGWEFHRRHRLWSIALGAYVIVFCAIKLLILGSGRPIRMNPPNGLAGFIIAPVSWTFFYFVGVFSYGGMPFAEAERNLKAFAKEVAPELRKVRPAAKAA